MASIDPVLFTKLLIPFSLPGKASGHPYKQYAQWAQRKIHIEDRSVPLWETLKPVATLNQDEEDQLVSGGLRHVRDQLCEQLKKSVEKTGILANTLVPNFTAVWGLGTAKDLEYQNFVFTLSEDAFEELLGSYIITKSKSKLAWRVDGFSLVISPDGIGYFCLRLMGMTKQKREIKSQDATGQKQDLVWASHQQPITRSLADDLTGDLAKLKSYTDLKLVSNQRQNSQQQNNQRREYYLVQLLNGLLLNDCIDPRIGTDNDFMKSKRAHLLTSVFLDPEWLDDQGDLFEDGLRYAYYWRRASPLTYLPPKDHASQDCSYAQRLNRRVFLSREGGLLLTWAAKGSDTKFDCKYPRYFVDRYSLLVLHILIEEQTMKFMSYEAAQLLRETYKGAKHRQEIKTLVERMVGYNLSMNMLTCSEITEYQEFYQHLRSLRSIDQQRDDLSQGVDQLYEAVETSFRVDEDRRNQMINMVGLFVLPISLVTGIFGMNNFDPEIFKNHQPGWIFNDLTWNMSMIVAIVVGLILPTFFWLKRL